MILDIFAYFAALGIIIITWALIANDITSRKREHLIDHWHYSGDAGLAYHEFDLVDYRDHYWRVFFFRSARVLYGPLLQGVWDHTSNNVNTYDAFWWRCYKEVYMKFARDGNTIKKTRSYLARGFALPNALMGSGIHLNEWLLAEDQAAPSPKFSMMGGAEEYEAIMQTQELME